MSFFEDVAGTFFTAGVGDSNAEERGREAWERQHELRRTAYQDTAYSMREAGFNPILAVSKGVSPSTASVATPSGASAPVSFGQSEANSARAAADRELSGPGGIREAEHRLLSEQANSAASASNLTRAQTAATWASIPGISAEEALKLSQTGNLKQLTETSAASAREIEARTEKTGVEAEVLRQQLKGALTEGKIDETFYGEVLRMVNRALSSIGVAKQRDYGGR